MKVFIWHYTGGYAGGAAIVISESKENSMKMIIAQEVSEGNEADWVKFSNSKDECEYSYYLHSALDTSETEERVVLISTHSG